MTEFIQNILTKLGPDTLEMLDKEEEIPVNSAEQYSDNLQRSMHLMENIQMEEHISCVNDEAAFLRAECNYCKKKLQKYSEQLANTRKEIDSLPSKNPTNKLNLYTSKLENCQVKLNKLFNEFLDVEPSHLLEDMDKLMQDITANESKCRELKKTLEVYNGLPPNLTDAFQAVEDLKDEITKKKAGILTGDISKLNLNCK